MVRDPFDDASPMGVHEEPARWAFWVALVFSALCVAAPVAYLLAFASDVGRRRTLAFFVDFGFEATLVFGVVVPLQIYFVYVVLPPLVLEKLERSEKRATKFPYRTPLAETPLDYLLEEELPAREAVALRHQLDALRAEAAAARPSSPHGPRSFLRSSSSKKRNKGLAPSASALAASSVRGVSLEEYEAMYEDATWRPLWTSAVLLVLVKSYVVLPATLQDIAIEETLLAVPLAAFGATQALIGLENDELAWLTILGAAVVLGWAGLFVAAVSGAALHRRAHRQRLVRRASHRRSIATAFSTSIGASDDDDVSVVDSLPPPPPPAEKTASDRDLTPFSEVSRHDDVALVHCASQGDDDDDDVRESPRAQRPISTGSAISVSPADLRLHELVGHRVVIRGLKTRPDLNGLPAYVEAYDEDSKRYRVACRGAPFALRPENLERVVAEPAAGTVQDRPGRPRPAHLYQSI